MKSVSYFQNVGSFPFPISPLCANQLLLSQSPYARARANDDATRHARQRRDRKKKRTKISASYFCAIFFRWSLCAAVTSPLSGVHSISVSTTAWSISILLNPLFFPVALHSFSTNAFTFGFAHKSASEVPESSSGSDARRCTSLGKMIAIGCVASAVACTQIFDTTGHDLYVDSRRSRAMYSPPWSLMRFLMLQRRCSHLGKENRHSLHTYRSITLNVPSLFH